MKSYEDITERVFRKGDEILEKRRRRTAIIKRTSLMISGICAVVIVGFGVWKNNDLKNAFKNYSDDFQMVTENESVTQTSTEKPLQTSVTESEKYTSVTSVTTTVPNITESNIITSYTTEFSEITDSTVYTTTTLSQTSPINKTDYQTQPLQEVIQTTIRYEPQTDLTVTETEIISPPQNIDDEGSYYMKKFMSFISALTIMSSAMPTTSNASGVPFKVNPSRYWQGEKEIFAKMESGELDVDINGNGEFDIMDCYLLDAYRSEYYSYENDIDPEIVQRIESIADYDGNGTVDFDDTLHLMRYFIVDGNIKYEYLNPAYYDPDIEPLTTEDDFGKYKEIQAYVFPMRMFYHVEYLEAQYYLIDELYQSGTADLDINGNGQLDVDDIYCMDVFFTEKKTEVIKQILTEEEYQKCWDFSFYYSEHLVPHNYYGPIMSVAVAAYILNHIEVKQEYFTIEYYKENIEGYVSSYSIPSLVINAASKMGIEVSDNIGPTYDINDFHYMLNMNEFTPFFDSYCSDVENGIRPAPDVNMDGVVDYMDYFDINIYWSDKLKGSKAEKSILPAETWNNINENYDLDGEGTSASIYDLTAVQLYVIKYADEIDDVDGSYYEYVQSLCETPEPISTTANYEDNIKVLLSLDIERSGNANNDDDVNIADAVLIMQSIANPDNYKLTTKGKFNADVYNTGDGITASDALQIQMMSTTQS
ncbi:MAG: dockerin type I repeat-containing protein [Ruminococcus sp.]|nr:dockerin type I repeat-containing protein [Ruminococcus sp.]